MDKIMKSIFTHFGALVVGAVFGVVVMAFAIAAGDDEKRMENARRNQDEGEYFKPIAEKLESADGREYCQGRVTPL